METLINQFTTLPTLTFFAIWAVLFSLLFFSIIVGFDMDLGIDIDTDSPSSLPSFFIARGLTKIPLVLSLFIVFTIGLGFSYCLQWMVLPLLGITLFSGSLGALEISIGVFLFFPIFILSLYISSPILSFLGKHIKNPEKAEPLNLVGMKCIIITGTVSSSFGEAIIKDGTKEYKIHVISNENLVFDDVAIVVEPKNENGDYLIKKFK